MLAERYPSSRSASLGVTGEVISHPSRSRSGWCRKRLFPRRKGTSGFLHRSGPSVNQRFTDGKVHRYVPRYVEVTGIFF